MHKIRVVIADDSALMRKKIAEILNSDSNIEVVAIARNGKEAIEAVHSLKPDVVTLDVEMPILNGLDALGYIMSEIPTPCVMISAFTKNGTNETIRSLEFGAVDFVSKPSGVISLDIGKVGNEIIEKVKLAGRVLPKKLRLIFAERAKEEPRVQKKPSSMNRVFAIASSTGGTQALSTIIPSLREDFPASVLVVQHMPEGFTKSLSERLNWQSRITVVEAQNNMEIKPATVIIAKGGQHMKITGDEKRAVVVLSDEPSVMGLKPCANIMMESTAMVFKSKVVGIILTGMGRDGTKGAEAIKLSGGTVITEDEDSCIVYGMPKSVVEANLSDKTVTLHELAHQMEQMV